MNVRNYYGRKSEGKLFEGPNKGVGSSNQCLVVDDLYAISSSNAVAIRGFNP